MEVIWIDSSCDLSHENNRRSSLSEKRRSNFNWRLFLMFGCVASRAVVAAAVPIVSWNEETGAVSNHRRQCKLSGGTSH